MGKQLGVNNNVCVIKIIKMAVREGGRSSRNFWGLVEQRGPWETVSSDRKRTGGYSADNRDVMRPYHVKAQKPPYLLSKIARRTVIDKPMLISNAGKAHVVGRTSQGIAMGKTIGTQTKEMGTSTDGSRQADFDGGGLPAESSPNDENEGTLKGTPLMRNGDQPMEDIGTPTPGPSYISNEWVRKEKETEKNDVGVGTDTYAVYTKETGTGTSHSTLMEENLSAELEKVQNAHHELNVRRDLATQNMVYTFFNVMGLDTDLVQGLAKRIEEAVATDDKNEYKALQNYISELLVERGQEIIHKLRNSEGLKELRDTGTDAEVRETRDSGTAMDVPVIGTRSRPGLMIQTQNLKYGRTYGGGLRRATGRLNRSGGMIYERMENGSAPVTRNNIEDMVTTRGMGKRQRTR